MLRLHHHPLSIFARRVRIALLEKNVSCELVEVDMRARAHKAPQFLALNPYGRVPVLEDDGFVLAESTAILDYLEARHPEPALVPADPQGRALVAMHSKLCDLHLGVETGPLIFPLRFLPREKWDTGAMDRARERIIKHLEIVEAQLGDREYMVGDRYSLVEVCYTPLVEFLHQAGITPPPRVDRWIGRMLARPSALATKPTA
jgi:glutathione S-transferase